MNTTYISNFLSVSKMYYSNQNWSWGT